MLELLGALAILGFVAGILIGIPLVIFVVTATVRAQNYARQLVERGKIDDLKKANTTLTILNGLSDNQSRALWNDLKNLIEKTKQKGA